MDGLFDNEADYLGYEEDSMSENGDSSEDEIDILLQSTPEQKLKLSRRRSSTGCDPARSAESSEDEFEKEMDRELDAQVAAIESRRKPQTSEKMDDKGENSTKPSGGNSRSEVYFDSDEEEMIEGEKKGKKGEPLMSNDDLLYDPNMDDDDQQWMDNRRKKYLPEFKNQKTGQRGTGHTGQSQPKLPNSDAVLDCPACLTTLCYDCQRHDVYMNQYRAMFVCQCTVDFSEKLKYPKVQEGKKRKKKTRFSQMAESVPVDSENTTDNADCDFYHPVRCTECNTLVAMFDVDEIYHFFNVVSSYS